MSIPPQSDLDKMILGEGKGCLESLLAQRHAGQVRAAHGPLLPAIAVHHWRPCRK